MFINLGALSQDAGFNTLTSTPGDDTHSLLRWLLEVVAHMK